MVIVSRPPHVSLSILFGVDIRGVSKSQSWSCASSEEPLTSSEASTSQALRFMKRYAHGQLIDESINAVQEPQFIHTSPKQTSEFELRVEIGSVFGVNTGTIGIPYSLAWPEGCCKSEAIEHDAVMVL